MDHIKLISETDFDGWRTAARQLALREVTPSNVAWRVEGDQSGLFDTSDPPPCIEGRFTVPMAFVELAQIAILHRDPCRFDLLYRLLCRLRPNPELLSNAVDADVARAGAMVRSVRRDEHKMHAFVRFREVACDGGRRFIAWFEPTHHIVELAAPFFAKRFAGMDWSILTPDRCAHWHDRRLSFTAGVGSSRVDLQACKLEYSIVSPK